MNTRRLINVRDIKLEPENFSNIGKMFSGTNLNSHDRGKEVMTKLLNNIGIARIERRGIWNVDDLHFDETTLVINPFIRNMQHNTNNLKLRTLIQTKFSNISGWNATLRQNKIQQPLDSNIKRLMYENIPIGDFYSDRNLLIINFNMFPQYPSLSLTKTVCDFVKEVLKVNEVVIENEVNIEKIREINKVKNTKLFMDHITTREIEVKKGIETKNNEIIQYNKKIVNNYHKIEVETIEVVSIGEFKKNFKNNFENQLKELEELDFVEKVSLDREGILIEVGNLSLGRGSQKTYIGYMYFLITPSQIKILNKYSKENLQHPHVNNNQPCFGTYSEGIHKLLGKMDLKRLVFTLNQFLYTYTGHGTFTGGTLPIWKRFRTTENKFDTDGNTIKIMKNDKHEKN